jgi:hypothetical protein
MRSNADPEDWPAKTPRKSSILKAVQYPERLQKCVCDRFCSNQILQIKQGSTDGGGFWPMPIV